MSDDTRPGDEIKFVLPGDGAALANIVALDSWEDVDEGRSRGYLFRLTRESLGVFFVLCQRTTTVTNADGQVQQYVYEAGDDDEGFPVAVGSMIDRGDGHVLVKMTPLEWAVIDNGWWNHFLSRIAEVWGDVFSGREVVSAEKLETVQQVDVDAAVAAEAFKFGQTVYMMGIWRRLRVLNQEKELNQEQAAVVIGIKKDTVKKYCKQMRDKKYYTWQRHSRKG